MRRGWTLAAAALAAGLLAAAPASAGGLAEYDETLRDPRDKWVDVHAFFRTRGELLWNLDLDRGPTPSGQLLYPVPLSDPRGQLLARADLRLRTDLALYLPQGGLSVKLRVDALDNLALGSDPVGAPAAATRYAPENAYLRVKRAYGEFLSPFGLLAAGRMGNHWGLGMVANGGDCEDCDGGDAADRIAFVTPLLGHLWAVAWDFTAAGPLVPDKTETRAVDIDPTTQVHQFSFAILNARSDLSRNRRAKAGKATVEYGATFSHRFQSNDVPATYLTVATPVPVDAAQVVHRGFGATLVDAWLKISGRGFRVEAEGAYGCARVEQASLLPGVTLKGPVTSNQWGFAVETQFGDPGGRWSLGFDGGAASGDSAPGFGAFPKLGAASPRPGDLDGAQARPPYDNTVDNFRFNSDYRVDRILFREIVGAVTDAAYLRPHAKVALFQNPKAQLELGLFAVASFALNASSTPGNDLPLGVELDPTLRLQTSFGFAAALEQATLFPLAGLDNRELGLKAQPAQLWRLRLVFKV